MWHCSIRLFNNQRFGESEFWEIQHTLGRRIPTTNEEEFINSNGIENCTRINTKKLFGWFLGIPLQEDWASLRGG